MKHKECRICETELTEEEVEKYIELCESCYELNNDDIFEDADRLYREYAESREYNDESNTNKDI